MDQTVNCRAAVFILLKDSVIFGETELNPDRDHDPFNDVFLFNDTDCLRYDLLFSDIERLDESAPLSKAVPDYWKAAGIRFPDGNPSLMMTYGVETGLIKNYHAAIAIYDKGEVWLLEKYNPIHPHQLSLFSDESKMIEYLKKCVSGVDEAAVFSNGLCLWSKPR